MSVRLNNGILLALLLAVAQPVWAQDEGANIDSVPDESIQDEPMQEPLEEPAVEPPEVLVEAEPADPSQLPPFPPRSQFDDMLERPLFHSSRRPQADDDAGGGSAQELRETWKLTGIVMVGDNVKALFQERNGERRLTLGAGMPLDANWVLDEINPNTVIMGSGDEQVTLELLEPRDTAPVETPKESGEDESQEEPGSVDERTRAASQQLEEDAESVKETPDE